MLINPITKTNIDEYLQAPFHAVLIVGAKDSGKRDLVQRVVKGLVDSDLETYPYKTIVDGQNDGIEQIRAIKKEFSYKFVSKDSKHKRVVVITSIESISRESHNAMLKLLEEPPEKTYIIATATGTSDLPETILSRMKQIRVLPVDEQATATYLATNSVSSADARKLWLKSGGLAGKIKKNSDNTDANESSELAKKFISSKKYERLIMVNDLTKLERQTQKEIMDTLLEITYFKLSNSDDTVEIKKLIQKNSVVENSINSLSGNVNPKLLWLDLSLNL